jgi:hypothetical protein
MLKGFESNIVMNIIGCYKTIIGKTNINPHYQYEKNNLIQRKSHKYVLHSSSSCHCHLQ